MSDIATPSHSHGSLETSHVIAVIPADVAATIVKLFNELDREPKAKQALMFCGEPRMIRRFDKFTKEFRDKFDKRFDQDYIDSETKA